MHGRALVVMMAITVDNLRRNRWQVTKERRFAMWPSQATRVAGKPCWLKLCFSKGAFSIVWVK
jgi:hypothetical protein